MDSDSEGESDDDEDFAGNPTLPEGNVGSGLPKLYSKGQDAPREPH